ncbi:DUF5960 family protein [Candidatus Enterococcus clewellii]|uniref:Uncharacterized protein n=1 Tax=Candidatus Enterococcus clewellii TaxID=1834193 RepID=A0A242K634_9ENTE|nr:DUF5960 family protein [Enterococcus sp. 9E7_DIV0242]OTP15778.1 hypothetical protein A5888_001992 [Enterococcus sp. 9E7_DIV0242]
MLENVIKQQETFLTDYRNVSNQPNESDEKILERVLLHLNQTGENTFTLPAAETASGVPATFPFERQLLTREYDGTLETEYTYAGKPFEVDEQTDEQPEW